MNAVATGVLPDGRLVAVTASPDGTVRVWDLTTGTPIGDTLTGHTSEVAAVATGVLPDGPRSRSPPAPIARSGSGT